MMEILLANVVLVFVDRLLWLFAALLAAAVVLAFKFPKELGKKIGELEFIRWRNFETRFRRRG